MISPMEEETLRKDLRVPESMRCSRVVRSLEFTHLWMSSGASESSLHFDTEDNMMMMKGGTKQVWMIDPQDSRHVYMDYHDKYGLSPLKCRHTEFSPSSLRTRAISSASSLSACFGYTNLPWPDEPW